jgi:hypothetical protein
MPPGLAGGARRVPNEAGYRIIPGAEFRHSSVRGDFRVYRTAAGIVASWRTELSARSLDGKPLWRKADQGRAVGVSPDGTRIVSTNQAGLLVILDATTGDRIGEPVQLGGTGDPKRTGVWISAFAWMPDGKHILAVDARRVYLLDWTGALVKELPVACKDECFFSAAIGVTSDEALLADTPGSSRSRLLRIKITDGSAIAAADYYANNPISSARRSSSMA